NLHAKGSFDGLEVAGLPGKGAFGLERGAKVEGDLKHLRAAPDGAFELKARAQVEADVKGYSADLPGVSVAGTARLKAKGDVGTGREREQVADVRLSQDGKGSAGGISAKVGKITGGSTAKGEGIGTLSPAEVQRRTATQIAGAVQPVVPASVDPIALASAV